MIIGNRKIGAAVLAVVTATALSACVTNGEVGNPDGWKKISPAANPALAKLVPADIRQKGHLTVGSNTPYAPAQFKDSNGKIIGYEVDLIKAAGSLLGLEVDVRQMDFNLIPPAISAGTVDVGASSFTDTEEREQTYDFVDFYRAGTQWATQPGSEKSIDPDNGCGLTVAVQKGTYSDTDELPAKNDKCTGAGKPEITKLVYPSADAAATATVLGRAQAYSSDSPVIAFAAKRAEGKLAPIGEPFDTAPFGWAVQKGSPLSTALIAALQQMLADGTYRKILKPWGLEKGAVDSITFNLEPVPDRRPDNATTDRRTQ
ncbi:ABC transporter substrate-binding protein [Corynebacterium heidelbergense]|uniref:ABC transporter substrate-binding protein n=1 Tax=Corynebacterium heidelbergense TaxID=2055947 RepID=A0A364VA43_9CORY|nr:ABC transporter substrate-binding protein [Corynebacterium heidelbergense]RAV33543.1 ABC transporter substrate-binding protein [Corynebacterium heidelbergense]